MNIDTYKLWHLHFFEQYHLPYTLFSKKGEGLYTQNNTSKHFYFHVCSWDIFFIDSPCFAVSMMLSSAEPMGGWKQLDPNTDPDTIIKTNQTGSTDFQTQHKGSKLPHHQKHLSDLNIIILSARWTIDTRQKESL